MWFGWYAYAPLLLQGWCYILFSGMSDASLRAKGRWHSKAYLSYVKSRQGISICWSLIYWRRSYNKMLLYIDFLGKLMAEFFTNKITLKIEPFLLRRSLLGQRSKNVKITACGDLSSPTVGVLSFAKTLKTSDYSYHRHYHVLVIFRVILNQLKQIVVYSNTLSCYW